MGQGFIWCHSQMSSRAQSTYLLHPITAKLVPPYLGFVSRNYLSGWIAQKLALPGLGTPRGPKRSTNIFMTQLWKVERCLCPILLNTGHTGQPPFKQRPATQGVKTMTWQQQATTSFLPIFLYFLFVLSFIHLLYFYFFSFSLFFEWGSLYTS